MDVFHTVAENENTIRVVDMHTSGEPTRIIVSGYPDLQGDTLLEKRRCAREHHDHIRRLYAVTSLPISVHSLILGPLGMNSLMLEPRGHDGMYGVILVQETELTRSGEADIGVLFCHNEGYSTMCGHATVALGRFLIDTSDKTLFPNRNTLHPDNDMNTIHLKLHAPCGLIRVSVPITDGGKSDPTKPISFHSVPSFVTTKSIDLVISKELAWPQLDPAGTFPVSVAYGGAFYIIVSAQSLGFSDGLRSSGSGSGVKDIAYAAEKVETLMNTAHRELFVHPREKDLGFCYGVMVVDKSLKAHSSESETGLCFFAGGQIDRSPTGSCVSARVALAIEEGTLRMGEWWTYESAVSVTSEGNGFRGRGVERVEEGVVVQIEGRAFYTGCSSFEMPEDCDVIGTGFKLVLPAKN
ncbi:hypothetical protein VNI00_008833 [Paramarasmius palmivorus]|uniref:trans-L-3-hydroxyproline dehydratase n=1 Tax=Paramarasmius palmivorus TaxID=297713 RepID=A0AAW0CT33_9AGAR